MITIDQQQRLLVSAARRLTRKITVYAIGGTAMMFLGFKNATLDIDLVFENEKGRAVFAEAIQSLGYEKMEARTVYGTKRNIPEMFRLQDERFDLFVVEVIDFIFSETMRKRAEPVHQFVDNLILKIADPHDIILMKCATDRLKDKDDARTIITATKMNWDIIIEEAKKQIELGKERAAFDLGCFLEDLQKIGVDIPSEALDKLFEIVEKQAREKKSKP
ncbi:MAG TPA: DUF6036 family nucleotidyltransferase [Candidatus Nanoarchaeia archaeon]|nr:DUF6036 family nucleotidyltransferase [Candidatus Nanoarchaeia archaeon]